MNILAFDTSSPQFVVGIQRGEQLVTVPPVRLQKTLSTSIIPRIDELLQKAALPLAQIDGFAVGLGPGSFTSLRVGVATAKGLAAATGKPLIGVVSLDILAENVREAGRQTIDQVCCLNDARRNSVYGAVYALAEGQLERKSPYLLTSLPDVLQYVKGHVLFLGDGVEVYRRHITETAEKTKVFTPEFANEALAFPQSPALLRLAHQRFVQQQYDDVDRLVPLYLYPQDCQVRH